jgi:hypothetical protein
MMIQKKETEETIFTKVVCISIIVKDTLIKKTCCFNIIRDAYLSLKKTIKGVSVMLNQFQLLYPFVILTKEESQQTVATIEIDSPVRYC